MDVDIQVLEDASAVLGHDRPTLLVLGRPSCDECQRWYDVLRSWMPDGELEVLSLDLTHEVGMAYKAQNTWSERIDFIPFNVLYVNGQSVSEWRGGSLERLIDHLRRSGDASWS